jgi:hypothetical protein
VGTLGGVIAAGEAVGHSRLSEGPAVATFLAMSIGISILGYYAGRSIDRQVTRIRLVP